MPKLILRIFVDPQNDVPAEKSRSIAKVCCLQPNEKLQK